MSRWLWRVVFLLVARSVLGLLWGLTLRVGPALAVGLVGLLCWPSCLAGWAIRRKLLPWIGGRWTPRAALGVAAAGLVAGGAVPLVLLAQGASAGTFAALVLGSGLIVPALLVGGAAGAVDAAPGWRPLLAASSAAAAGWAAVVLAAGWPQVATLARWSIIRLTAEKPDGSKATGNRQSEVGLPVAVAVRPVPTQRIATATFGDDAWTVRPLFGPGLLSMVVAPPGVGKTELVYGALAAAHDGLPFCGLETAKPRRVLLLSEMEPKTIQPALKRWGFVAEPGGRLDSLRLRWLRPDGSPGHLIDVVHASDAYAPDDSGRRPQWADVIRAVLPVLARGRYDLLVVDSLARWMGNDSSNAVMLDALGVLRQVTRMGVGVVAPHHCGKDAQAPYQPRGGSAILGELDLCWSLARLPGCADPLHDPKRVLECVKSRFAEETPPPLRLERVELDPDAPRPRFGYRPLAAGVTVTPVEPAAAVGAKLTAQQRKVLEALCSAPERRATTPELTAATGLGANRIKEAAVALIKAGLARVDGAGEVPARGGVAPVRYRATPLGAETLGPVALPAGGEAAATRLLHEALDG